MTGQSSIILDVNGTNIQAEGAHLRAHGPAMLVELPGGVNGEITEDRPRHSLLSNGHVGVPVLCRPGG